MELEPGHLQRAKSEDSVDTFTSRKSSPTSAATPVKVVTRLRPLRTGERRQAIFPDWSSTLEDEDGQVVEVEEDFHPNGLTKENQTPGVTTPKGKSPTGILQPSASRIPALSRSRWMRPKTKGIPHSLIVESSHLSPGPSHNQARLFSYDAVLTEDSTQAKVYQQSVGNAIRRNLLRGYNTTVMAYGQVGSGKTYTMYGPPRSHANDDDDSENSYTEVAEAMPDEPLELSEEDGIIPRAMKDVFDAIADLSEKEVSLEMTIMEIYRDELRDLLVDQSNLPLQLYDHHHEQGVVVVHGLRSVEVYSLAQALRLFRIAQRRRTTSSTVNHESSRSHVICTLSVTVKPTATSCPSSPAAVLAATTARAKHTSILRAKLTLVDLAGSERLVHTPTNKSNSEAITINKDLFVLGKVVATLASQPAGHVPYRDSKLTRILRDSLGGNCCTVLIACVSTAEINLEESLHTLRYAARARTITHTVRRNVLQSPLSAHDASFLRAENQRLKARLDQYSAGVQMAEFSSLQSKLFKAEQEAQRAREHAKSVRRTADKWKEQFEKIKVARAKMKLFMPQSSAESLGKESTPKPTSIPSRVTHLKVQTKPRDEMDDDLDALLGDDSELTEGLGGFPGNEKQELGPNTLLQDPEVFEKGIVQMSEEMKALADEKIRLADQVAELNELLAQRQSKILSLEEDYNFRQSEMSAHIAKQEKQRDQLEEEVDLLKQKVHLLASDMKQEQAGSLSSVFRRQGDEGGFNSNEVEMQTWRTETTFERNSQAEADFMELKEALKSKELECNELHESVKALTAENLELKDENAKLRAALHHEMESHFTVRKYSGDGSIGSQTTGTAGNDLFISNLNDMMKQGVCLYELSPLATNSKQIEFYLPKLRVFCPCGKHSVSDDKANEDPTALSSILRSWQIEFLKSASITHTLHLLQASRHRASDVAKQMRKWRRKQKLHSFHTASCAVALHIWSRTCIRVLKSVHQQKVQGRAKPVLPDFMEYKLDPDLYTVSSIGQQSHPTALSEDEGAKPSSRVLFGVPETRSTDEQDKPGDDEEMVLKLRAQVNAIPVPKDEYIQSIFEQVDRNGDGKLSMAEVEKAIIQRKAQFDLKPTIVMRAFQRADTDGDGFVTRKEFFSFVRCITYFKNLWNVFAAMDLNGDNRLSKDEFMRAARALRIEDPEDVFIEMDENKGGYVVFDEFCIWMAEKQAHELSFQAGLTP